MKKILVLFALSGILYACGGGDNTSDAEESSSTSVQPSISDYDPSRGEGRFSSENVKVTPELDKEMAARGKKASEMKCLQCHKLSDEKLVGPGWQGATERHTPEWIMNFMTNTDAMIDKDPKVQAMLEICLVRMPNQNLEDQEARDIVEFMRENDGVK